MIKGRAKQNARVRRSHPRADLRTPLHKGARLRYIHHRKHTHKTSWTIRAHSRHWAKVAKRLKNLRIDLWGCGRRGRYT